MSEKKILHLTTGKNIRGGERQVIYLHRALLNKGISSYVAYRKNSAMADFNIPGSFSHNISGFYDIFNIAKTLLFCKRNNITILHCHDSRAFSTGYVMSLISGIKMVMTRRAVFKIRNTPFNRNKFSRASAVIAISQAVKNECERICPEKNVEIIHSGVSVDPDEPDRKTARSFLSLPQNRFIIGTVGFFSAEKNLPLIIKLGDKLEKTDCGAIIACIGKIHENDREITEKHPSIYCTGHIENAHRYYNAFNLYVSASTEEGLGTALLDALIRKIPSVAADSGGSTEIFPENSSLHIEKNNSELFISTILDLIKSPELFKNDLNNIFKNIETNFSISQMRDRHINLYRKITE